MKPLISLRTKLGIGVGVTLATGGALLAIGLDLDRPSERVVAMAKDVPLEMWSATALDADGKPRGETQVCADPLVRQGFELPLPRINGSACLLVEAPVLREGRFDGRCKVGSEPFVVNILRTGDPASDFTVRMHTEALAIRDAEALQIIRYRKLGPCPTDWRAGQAVNPATGKTYDALDTRM